ncbi:MAG: glutamate 5-kinase [Clostridia bacterium]|nr:glutamate 5-kinase [Clostridia bacterium]
MNVYQQIKNAKRVVVKVGTSTLTHHNGRLNLRRIERLTRTLSDLKNQGREIILVSSGAVGAGAAKLGLRKKPDTTAAKQAAAAVGQVELMNIYGRLFSEYGYTVAQVLLTKDVLDGDTRQKNAEVTFEQLLNMDIIPIVNENDTISSDELEFGDNDTLSARVARLTNADVLIILSDIDGLYDSDPHTNDEAMLIRTVTNIDSHITDMGGGSGSAFGTGGMATKISAAKIATGKGIHTIIANGQKPDILFDIFDGKSEGTVFVAGGIK